MAYLRLHMLLALYVFITRYFHFYDIIIISPGKIDLSGVAYFWTKSIILINLNRNLHWLMPLLWSCLTWNSRGLGRFLREYTGTCGFSCRRSPREKCDAQRPEKRESTLKEHWLAGRNVCLRTCCILPWPPNWGWSESRITLYTPASSTPIYKKKREVQLGQEIKGLVRGHVHNDVC